MDLDTEKKLVLAAKTDTDSFAKLYDYYFPKVYAFVLSKVRDSNAAEDLVADIFMKMVRYLPKFEWRGLPFGAWVFRIARNRVNDYYRSIKKEQSVDLEHVKESEHQQTITSPSADAKQTELKATFEKILEKMPEREACVIRLKFFSDLSNKDIAKALELSETNVGVIIFRTLKSLKPELENFK